MKPDCSAFREASQLTDVQKSEQSLDETRTLDKRVAKIPASRFQPPSTSRHLQVKRDTCATATLPGFTPPGDPPDDVRTCFASSHRPRHRTCAFAACRFRPRV